jgi:hypothetical protein
MQIISRLSRRHPFVSRFALVVALGTIPLAAAVADEDPPTRVGRIGVLSGTVSFHPSADADWAPAEQNYPVAPGTALWADQGGKAEVQIGAADVLLDEGTELDIIQVDDQNVVLAVPQGRADVSLYDRGPDETYNVQTPRGTVTLLDNGTYRIIAGSDQDPSRAASFGGRAQFDSANPLTVTSGLEVVATVDDPTQYSVAQTTEDAFDEAAIAQQKALHATPLPSYVPPMPGVAALSEYGAWHDSPQYGHVWTPTHVEAGWAPYHHGHWAFIKPWGYTWCDDAPWGFAPFHYGRWVQVGGSWGWVAVDPAAPPYHPGFHPVYAPALVAFVGNPAALTVGVGVGGVRVGASVGWFPLGPGEVYRPWYPHSENYVRNVNVVNVNRTVIENIHNTTIINNNIRYVNERSVTVVPQRAFAGGEAVSRAAVHVSPEALSKPISVAPSTEISEKVLPKPEHTVGARPVGAAARDIKAPPAPALKMAHPAAASAASFHEANPTVPTEARPVVKRTVPPVSAKPPPKLDSPSKSPEPVKAEPVKPDAAKPEPAKPVNSHEPTAKSEPVKPEAAKPGEHQAPATKPEPAKPEAAKPVTPHEPPAKAEPVKPETAKPVEHQAPVTKPEPAKPEAPKPVEHHALPKPETAKPEPAKPEAAKPTEHKQPAAKPEAAKPTPREDKPKAEPAKPVKPEAPAHKDPDKSTAPAKKTNETKKPEKPATDKTTQPQ